MRYATIPLVRNECSPPRKNNLSRSADVTAPPKKWGGGKNERGKVKYRNASAFNTRRRSYDESTVSYVVAGTVRIAAVYENERNGEYRIRRYRQSPITQANDEDVSTNVRPVYDTRHHVRSSQWLTFGNTNTPRTLPGVKDPFQPE